VLTLPRHELHTTYILVGFCRLRHVSAKIGTWYLHLHCLLQGSIHLWECYIRTQHMC